MLFFTRILKFKHDLLAKLRDQRKQTRYHVGAAFPLKAVVSLVGDAGPAVKGKAARPPGCDWSGRVSDVSANGLSVLLPPAAATARSETTTVRLSLEGRNLEIPCTVAHFKSQNTHATCGIRLEFSDFPSQKAYCQIVEAVSLGASFAPAGGNRDGRVSLGLARRQWHSLKGSRLTEWRETGSHKLDRFELIIEGHVIGGRAEEPGLEILSESRRTAVAPAMEAEIRQLFCWVTANLPAGVPADLREFMLHTAATPVAPVKSGTSPQVATASSPSEWQPPTRSPRNAPRVD